MNHFKLHYERKKARNIKQNQNINLKKMHSLRQFFVGKIEYRLKCQRYSICFLSSIISSDFFELNKKKMFLNFANFLECIHTSIRTRNI